MSRFAEAETKGSKRQGTKSGSGKGRLDRVRRGVGTKLEASEEWRRKLNGLGIYCSEGTRGFDMMVA
jgi:hypothetical protein